MSDYKSLPVAYDGPGRIYLQWYNPDHDFGVQWCPDQINDDDVEYVTAAQLEAAEQRVAELERQNELLRAVAVTEKKRVDWLKRHGLTLYLDKWSIGELQHFVAGMEMVKANLQAAIDGGALGEGE